MATNKVLDLAVPAAANQWAADFTLIRDNWIVLAGICSSAIPVLPGWGTAVNGADKSQPDSIVLTKNSTSLKIKIEFTWSSGQATTMKLYYDDGGGYDAFDDGLITLTYDVSGNLSSATSADIT